MKFAEGLRLLVGAFVLGPLVFLLWSVLPEEVVHELQESLESIEHWQQYVAESQFCDPPGWELQNMLTISHVIVRAALERKESRGVHLRTDYPNLDDQHWLRRITFKQ